MFLRACVVLVFGLILEWNPTQSAPADLTKSKGKEKVRAYEFGFSIEEQQHRHEKRDENGIVMGEFGFITADGIYHVTVYATDENGKFKILAMKSYPYRSPEKKIMAVTLPPVQRPAFSTAAPSDTKSCGGCVLPKKAKPPAPADVKVTKQQSDKSESLFRPLSKTISDGVGPLSKGAGALPSQQQPPKAASTGGNGKTYPLTPLQTTGPPKGTSGQDLSNRMSKSFPTLSNRFGSDDQVPPQRTPPPQNTITQGTVKVSPPNEKSLQPFSPKFGASTPEQNTNKYTPGSQQNTNTANTSPPVIKSTQPLQAPPQFSKLGAFTPDTTKSTPTQGPTPTGPQQQIKIVPKTQTPTTKLTPLPQAAGTASTKLTPQTIASGGAVAGNAVVGNAVVGGAVAGGAVAGGAVAGGSVSGGAVAGGAVAGGAVSGGALAYGGGPLYRFNYVLDYNSHKEEGRIDGSKEGNYKAIDEGGIRRIVDYIANENGFQPHIKWERVPMSELPTGDNKLKEYEFVWFNKA